MGVCWGGGGGEGVRMLVDLVPLLEQRIAKHTLNSVLKLSKLKSFTLFSLK